jgi:hypothetical protein
MKSCLTAKDSFILADYRRIIRQRQFTESPPQIGDTHQSSECGGIKLSKLETVDHVRTTIRSLFRCVLSLLNIQSHHERRQPLEECLEVCARGDPQEEMRFRGLAKHVEYELAFRLAGGREFSNEALRGLCTNN